MFRLDTIAVRLVALWFRLGAIAARLFALFENWFGFYKAFAHVDIVMAAFMDCYQVFWLPVVMVAINVVKMHPFVI